VPPTFDIEATFTQLMSSMGALQREVNLIGESVEQCQIDIRECLQYHHPNLMMMTDFFFCIQTILNIVLIFYISLNTYGLIKYFVYPLLLCDKKGEYFWLILVFRPGMYFQIGQVFLSQNGQRGSLLVFYVGYILDKQKHFMKWLRFNRMIGVYSESSCFQTMFKSKLVTDHKHLEDIHEESLRIPRQINQFLCNRPDGPLKASGRPSMSSSFTLKTSGRQSNTVRMLGQSVFNKELDFKS